MRWPGSDCVIELVAGVALSIAGIILAAGSSGRMGKGKAELLWRGTPLLRYQLEQALAAGLDPVVVVLGAYAEQNSLLVPDGVQVVRNKEWSTGRASSIRAGMAALPEALTGVVFVSLDQPARKEMLWAVSDTMHNESIITVWYGGVQGHPVGFGEQFFPELHLVDESSFGLRAVIQRHGTIVQRIPLSYPEVVMNLNTPAQYDAAVALVKGNTHEH
jgi:molybdenum cofactor cytidylyltransferase